MNLNVPNLDEIKGYIDKYRHMSRSELFTYCINNKLNAALKMYNLEVEDSVDLLGRIDDARVSRALFRMRKAEDKHVIEKYMTED